MTTESAQYRVARAWRWFRHEMPFLAEFWRAFVVIGIPLFGLILLARAVHDWAWLALLALPISWVYMHHWYVRIHGHRLRWWATWAAHGAVLFGFRLRRWEQ